MSYYHAIMFDFDGTIVDTMHEYARIASEEMSKLFEIPVESAKQMYMETSGIPFFQQLNSIFGPDDRNEKCSNNFESRKAEFLKQVELSEENRKTLSEIRAKGLSLAVTSNNFQELLDDFLKKEPELFDLVLGFGNGISKGPTQFTKVIDKFGIDRRHILFVGDSLSDVRKAFAFGVDFVAITGTIKKEGFQSIFPKIPIISNLSELLIKLETNKPINME